MIDDFDAFADSMAFDAPLGAYASLPYEMPYAYTPPITYADLGANLAYDPNGSFRDAQMRHALGKEDYGEFDPEHQKHQGPHQEAGQEERDV